MKKLWKKGDSEGMEYFSVLNGSYKTEIYHADKLTEKEIQDVIDRKGHAVTDWGPFVQTSIPLKPDPKDPRAVDLPHGTYRLKPSSDSLPTRLEVMSIRDEGYIPLESSKALVTDIGQFLKSRAIYDKLQFIYRRGYILYGEPGTGKTALIRHLANQGVFGKVHMIWMNMVPPSSVIEALNEIDGLKVIVLEEMLGENGRLNYDMQRLLEFMDGENSLRNCITIGTTNYPQFLHKNLADRPSRFDVLFEMEPQPGKVLKRVLEKWLDRKIAKDEFDYKKWSLAHLKEIVLLHKFNDISLKEAADKLQAQSKKFEKGFETKAELGFGIGSNDSPPVSNDDDEDYDD